MTDEQIEPPKVRCEDCEKARRIAIEKATIAGDLLAENRRLRIAFHDAIRRPLGVVPASGDEFYKPT